MTEEHGRKEKQKDLQTLQVSGVPTLFKGKQFLQDSLPASKASESASPACLYLDGQL